MAANDLMTARSDRARLDVPYSEKDEAKVAGARRKPAAKRWYRRGEHES